MQGPSTTAAAVAQFFSEAAEAARIPQHTLCLHIELNFAPSLCAADTDGASRRRRQLRITGATALHSESSCIKALRG
jgi:hypothetical protein